ncbi:MAG: M23 family metallopeptidase [Anaeromyxobacter sp.]
MSASAPRRLHLAIAISVIAAGCAHPAAKMSFVEAGFRGAALESAEPEGAPAPPADAAPESIASEAPEGPPIDGALLRFAAEARGRRGRVPAGRGFPEDAVRGWGELSQELDAYLGRALPQTPLLELVRARVTVEAEWDYDQRRYGPPPAPLAAAVSARLGRLARRLDAARALGLALFREAAPARLRWPVEHAGVSSTFGMRFHPIEHRRILHAGVDLTGQRGNVVQAAARGYVVRAGWVGGYGILVEVRHPGDVTTRYGHLSALLCGPGDAVDAGQPLGLVGATGRATGPHLHFEVWRGGEPEDPLDWLGSTMAMGPSDAPGVR